MDRKIILEGITLNEFQSMIRESIREEMVAIDSKKVAPLSKTEACRQLGITNKTLDKILKEMNMKEVFYSDINRILLKYPKYIRKALVYSQQEFLDIAQRRSRQPEQANPIY